MDRRDRISSSREIPKILLFLILKGIFRPWKLNWDAVEELGGVANATRDPDPRRTLIYQEMASKSKQEPGIAKPG
jgi:hypothetical protein